MNPGSLLFRLVLGLSSFVALSPAWAQTTDTEPEVTLSNESNYITGYHYIWRVPLSLIKSLPKWNPTDSEVPLSTYKAVQIATGYLIPTLPAKTKLSINAISLDPQGDEKDFKAPELRSIWAYQISFTADPEPPVKDAPRLLVLVLLDGTVVKPELSPLK